MFCALTNSLACSRLIKLFPSTEVRLVNGSDSYEGRVEIFENYQWSTICDTSWDEKDAGVICGQLGFERRGAALPGSHFGRGVGQISLHSIECLGDEPSLHDCEQDIVTTSDACDHSHDASVRCPGMLLFNACF